MSVFDSVPTTPVVLRADRPLDEAQLAAVAFLARYRGRTLESYRADLRQFFQWASDVGLPPLAATRAHIELYRASMDERGLAASTVDRRLSTVCGYYRFAHIDGRIGSNPAQYVRRPRVHPATRRGMDRGELAAFLYTAERTSPGHAALAVLLGLNGLRVSEACGTNIEDLGFERGHRTLRIIGKGNQPATVPLVPRTARTLDLAIGERTAGPILRALRRRPPRRPHRLPLGAVDRHPGRARPRPPAHAARRVHHGRPRRRRPAARRPTCRPPRRPENHHRVRPAPPELRPSRRLRRRRLRHQRMTTTDRPTAATGCHRTPRLPAFRSPGGQPGRRPSTSAQADNHRSPSGRKRSNAPSGRRDDAERSRCAGDGPPHCGRPRRPAHRRSRPLRL